MKISKRSIWIVAFVLVAIQAAEMVIEVHRESLTWDEENHMYAGYRMWKYGDYGLNPEHPPLVKLLATVPVLGEKLWVPPLTGSFFVSEAFLGGRDWLEHNDGGGQGLVFRMRMAAALLAIALSLMTFLVARDFFGDTAGLVALAILVFDPNLIAHSGLVTTDIGAALFFLAAIWAFYRICEAAYALASISCCSCDGTAAGDQTLGDSGGSDAAVVDRLGNCF